ncbi:MAG: CHAD domain-containing protein [Caldimonas sp.]
MSTETELKFAVDPKRTTTLEAALHKQGAVQRTIRSRYFDTEDGRLAGKHLALRLRKAEGAWEQTLKAPGPSAVEREEDTVARPGKWGTAGPEVHPELHATGEAGKALRGLLGDIGDSRAALLPVHESLIKRLVADVTVDETKVEVALDRGTIHAGLKSVPVCEVEYELKAGPPAAWVALARADVTRFGLWLSTVSKAARADRLARGIETGPPVMFSAPKLPPSTDGAALFRRVVAACLEQIIGNAGEIAEGRFDEEQVHQLRIGIRRLRTAARELAGLAPACDRSWEAPLTAAFRALGDYRDRHTVAPSIEARLQAAGSPSPSVQTAASEALNPVEIVRDPVFQGAMLDVLALALAPTKEPMPLLSKKDAKRIVVDRLRRLQHQLRRDAKRFESLDEDGQHRARKRLKRLRYLTELVEPLFRQGRCKAYLAELKPAQDAVGSHVELLLARRAARAASESEDPKAWFNVGWLGSEIGRSAKRARKALERAGRAPGFG